MLALSARQSSTTRAPEWTEVRSTAAFRPPEDSQPGLDDGDDDDDEEAPLSTLERVGLPSLLDRADFLPFAAASVGSSSAVDAGEYRAAGPAEARRPGPLAREAK